MRKLFLLTLLALCVFIELNAQWSKTSGPEGGYAEGILAIQDTLFVASTYDGIFRSKDNGDYWEIVDNGLPDRDIEAIYTYENTLYASIDYSGIYKSEDMGDTWEAINNGINYKTFYRLLVQDSNIYASNSEGGVYYSSDNGQNWLDRSEGISDDVIYSFTYFDSKIFAGGDSLYYSEDNGIGWKTIEIDGISSKIMSIVTTDTVMFLKSGTGIYISEDTAKTWSKASLSTNAAYGRLYEHNDTVFVSSSFCRIYSSIDNFVTWNMMQNGLSSILSGFCPVSGDYFMTTHDGIYKSEDKGVNWKYSDNGYTRLRILSMANNNDYIFAGTDDKGVFRSNDKGETWEIVNEGLDNASSKEVRKIVVMDDQILLATLNGLYKSNDNGDNWKYVNDLGTFQGITKMASSNGNLAAFVPQNGVYTSTDTGSTWNLSSAENFNLDYIYNCIEMKGDSIFLGTFTGNILISRDFGNTWKDLKLNSNQNNINEIRMYHDTLFVASSDDMYYTLDLGVTWKSFNNGLTANYMRDFYEAGDKYVASTIGGGIFVYYKANKKWYDIKDNFDNSVCNFLYVDDVLYMGTDRSSVWKRESLNISPIITVITSTLTTPEETEIKIDISNLVVEDPDNSFPSDFSLKINTGNNYTVDGTAILPDEDFNGNLSIPVLVNDGIFDSNVYNISIEVTAVNDAPKIVDANTLYTIEDTPIEIKVTDLTINDPDNDYPDDYSLSVYAGNNYSVNNTFVIPDDGYVGYLSVPVSVNDGIESDKFNVIVEVAESTGIQAPYKSNYNLYPNPADENVVIEFENDVYGLFSIKIYDSLGRIVFQKSKHKQTINFNERVDISQLDNGIYFIEVKNLANFEITEKIIKK